VRIALVPGVLALLPEYSSLTDPVADLRAACLEAVAWLGPDVHVVADPQGERVAAALLQAAAALHAGAGAGAGGEPAHLVVANGTARRSAASPGPYDDRAPGFDDALAQALGVEGEPDPEALRAIDQDLARELWAATTALPRLADLVDGARRVGTDFAGAPSGVHYWVMRWQV
jgi:hypothetical protein